MNKTQILNSIKETEQLLNEYSEVKALIENHRLHDDSVKAELLKPLNREIEFLKQIKDDDERAFIFFEDNDKEIKQDD